MRITFGPFLFLPEGYMSDKSINQISITSCFTDIIFSFC